MSGSGPKRPRAGRGPGPAGQRPRTSGAAPTQRPQGDTPWSPRREREEMAAPTEGAAGRKIQQRVPAQPVAAAPPVAQTEPQGRPFAHYRLADDAYRYVTGQAVAASSSAFAAVVTLVVTLTMCVLLVAGGIKLYGMWVVFQQGPQEGTLAPHV